jgi:hypothetical protein
MRTGLSVTCASLLLFCRTDRLHWQLNSFQATMTTFRTLEKAILSKEQLATFPSSNTYAKITSYIEALNNAVVGCKLTDECSQSQVRRRNLFGSCISPFIRQVAHLPGRLWLCDYYFRESRRYSRC